MRNGHAAPWRVIYIARGEKQALAIKDLLTQAGFYVDAQPPSHAENHVEDVEIRVLESEAQEARLLLMEQGY